MSEKKQRPVAEIQAEYTNLCTRAGHLQYSISALKSDLDLLNMTLKDLNIEGAEANKREEEAKASAAKEEGKSE